MNSTNILLVDDNDAFRRCLRTFLECRPEWHVCGEAADGIEAVEMARELNPDVILMDISMPRMDGLRATRLIHQDLPDSKVIIVSQNDSEVISRQTAGVGAAGFVTKEHMTRDLPSVMEMAIANGNGNSSKPAHVSRDPAQPSRI